MKNSSLKKYDTVFRQQQRNAGIAIDVRGPSVAEAIVYDRAGQLDFGDSPRGQDVSEWGSADDWLAIAQAVGNRSAEQKATTARFHRAVFLHFAGEFAGDHLEAAVAALDAATREASARVEQAGGVEHTSNRWRRHLSEREYIEIGTYLQRPSASQRDFEAFMLFTAALFTGFRRTEMVSAQLGQTDGATCLYIDTLKGKDGEQRKRVLGLDGYPSEILETIDRSLRLVKQKAGNHMGDNQNMWRPWVRSLAAASREVIHPDAGIEEPVVSFHTARHQFVANMKKERPIEEVAAMVGHDHVKTTIYQYGAARHGWGGGVAPVPSPEEAAVQRLRDTLPKTQDKVVEAYRTPILMRSDIGTTPVFVGDAAE